MIKIPHKAKEKPPKHSCTLLLFLDPAMRGKRDRRDKTRSSYSLCFLEIPFCLSCMHENARQHFFLHFEQSNIESLESYSFSLFSEEEGAA